MTFTYTPGGATALDDVRWLVSDTDPSDPLQQDEEIQRVLSAQPSVYRAAAIVARQIARQFARQCDLDIAREVRINLSDRSKNYDALAKELQDEANKGALGGGVGVYAGGLTPTRSAPAFCRSLMGTQASPSCRQCGQTTCACEEVTGG